MKQLPRLLLCALAGVILFACFGPAVAGWWAEENSFSPDLTGIGRDLIRELRRREALNVMDKAMLRGGEIKRATVRELLAGRISLAEAVEKFRQSNELIRDRYAEIQEKFERGSDEHELCRCLLGWAEMELRRDSGTAVWSLSDLEEQSRHYLGIQSKGPSPAP